MSTGYMDALIGALEDVATTRYFAGEHPIDNRWPQSLVTDSGGSLSSSGHPV